jgi:hypothetical protein
VLSIWRGQGWAVLPIYMAALCAVLLAVTQLVPGAKPGYASAHGWPLAIAFGLAGAINIIWGARTNWQPPVMMVDPENGMRRLTCVRHSFYYIPVEYWGAPGIALAVLLLYLLPP